jgi:hypothetical protein
MRLPGDKVHQKQVLLRTKAGFPPRSQAIMVAQMVVRRSAIVRSLNEYRDELMLQSQSLARHWFQTINAHEEFTAWICV